MKPPKEIIINRFQLAILLDDEQMDFYNTAIADNVFCSQCSGICEKGITISEIFLNPINDIWVKGECNICKGEVGRMFEFGEDKAFYDKAMDFRKSLRD